MYNINELSVPDGKENKSTCYRIEEEDESKFGNLTATNDLCQICLEPIKSSVTLSCGHPFCYQCLFDYFKCKILEGCVNFNCFYIAASDKNDSKAKSCSVKISEQCILDVISKDILLSEKYTKFKYRLEHPNSRECPRCNFAQLGSTENPSMKCELCKLEYCYLHASAHEAGNDACKAYIRKELTTEEYKVSQQYIASTSKQCPGCGMFVSKIGGCNHMKVSR